MRFWINTVSHAHVKAGVEGNFTQADHGKRTGLDRLEKGDLIVFYSPRTQLRGGDSLQAFTAIGCVIDEEPYKVETSAGFHHWRRRVEFFRSQDAFIRPLIEKLSFIKNKRQWGHPFRRGLFEVNRTDFEQIVESMLVELEAESYRSV